MKQLKLTTTSVRLYSYKSFRHYGGREITTTPYICKAEFVANQQDHSIVVKLLEGCAGFKSGHLIAVNPIDFDIK